MTNIVPAIQDANLDRHHASLYRRIIKVMEELGELSEAYLNVTSAKNGKDKTWDDVREEAADLVIVALDVALTPMPDRENQNTAEVIRDLEIVVARKLRKWSDNKLTVKNASDS